MTIPLSVSLADIVDAISMRQPVLNSADLTSNDKSITFVGISDLNNADSQHISFLSKQTYARFLATTAAGVVLVAPEFANDVPSSSIAIVVPSPYLAYASVSHLFDVTAIHNMNPDSLADLHPTAQIAHSAVVGAGVSIGAYCVIGDNVRLGEATQIQAHTTIGNDTVIGKHCVIRPHVTIAHDCQLGDDVRIHTHASIGAEGFGFAPTSNLAETGWERIAQLGRVIIGNNVRIGSQTCIDRGAIEDTVIEDNVIIDNLVQVAHNVHIGAGTAIAAKTGIAGSTTIGKRCMIGGAVGIAGHLSITDDVTLTGMTMVTKSIKKSGSYSSGGVAMPSMQWRRAVVRFKQLGKKEVTP